MEMPVGVDLSVVESHITSPREVAHSGDQKGKREKFTTTPRLYTGRGAIRG